MYFNKRLFGCFKGVRMSSDDSQAGIGPKLRLLVSDQKPADAYAMQRPKPSLNRTPSMDRAIESISAHTQINQIFNQLWLKDPETFKHCHRVADLAQATAGELGLSDTQRVEVYISGLLHDVGKTKTPTHILQKPGPLTHEEFSIMRLHPEDSGRMVAEISDIGYLAEAIRSHHERMDGRGYPDAKVGEAIPLYSRIVLVADTFDAMTNNRVYRKQIDLGRTYEELLRCSGTQFDPEAVKAFLRFHESLISDKKAA